MRAADLRALGDTIAGDVIAPDSPAYEDSRKPPIAAFRHLRPEAIVRCATPADVAATLALARRAGVRATPRSGGHCFAGRSSTGGIVVDVGPMRSVAVAEGVATVGAGARLGEIYDALDGHGRTIAGGCGPTVGIAGLALGGGIGILGRTHGLTSDQLVGAQVVLADGRTVECDAQRHEDLFWALRGAGGGQFGVVTALVLRTLASRPATVLHLTWRHDRAAAIVGAWQERAPAAPDALAASVLLTAAAGAQPVAHLFGAALATEAEAAELLEPIVARVGADPVSATMVEMPLRAAKRHLAEHGPGGDEPGVAYTKSELFARPLPAEAIAALARHLADGRRAGQSRVLDFTPLGGAYNRVPSSATAFAHRDKRFILKHDVAIQLGAAVADAGGTAGDAGGTRGDDDRTGAAVADAGGTAGDAGGTRGDDDRTRAALADTGGERAARDWLGRSWAIAHPWGSGAVYPNFPDPELRDWARAYHGANLERLRRVKARYDPDGSFRFHQSL